jgi:DNA-nicking Smr family endonuclease
LNLPDEAKTKRRQRHLSREELELWREVTRSVARLARAPAKRISSPAEPGAERPQQTAPSSPARPVLPGFTPAQHRRPAEPALAPIDRRLRKNLARGRAAVDDILDLHGMRQDEAHRALRSFLAAAQRSDAKMVLIVTGKGSRSGALGVWPASTGGVLQRAVPQWLAALDLRRIVMGFEEADAGHGGAGALYVRLRRADRARRRQSPDGS